MAFLSVVHVLLAVVVILLVLVQDSKGGGMGGAFGGSSGSNSILGPTGTPSLLNKLTRYTVIGFAVTSIVLTNLTSNKSSSALDEVKTPASGSVPTNPATAPAPVENSQPTTPAQPAPEQNK